MSKNRLATFLGYIFILAVILIIMFPLFNQPVTTQDVYQYIDYDTQVVCYILENGNGISCLPLSEVNLNE